MPGAVPVLFNFYLLIHLYIARVGSGSGEKGPDPQPFFGCRLGTYVVLQAPGNTVGSLQELCVKHGYPMPTYGMGPVGGQPHQRNFAMGKLLDLRPRNEILFQIAFA